MNVPAPDTWSIAPAPVGDPDCRAVLHAYLDELISRYYGRPAEETEIAHEVGDGTDLSGGRGVFLLARAGAAPVACAGVRWLSADTGELTRVFVTRSARRGGAGRRLVGAAEETARSRGVTRMLLNTRRDLTEAIALYTRLGYRPTDPYGDDPYAEIWLSKELV
ncbi:GNAT family N-acetyltransferase [Kitasatospora sp. DSM 101779]|uniref:GNAT family N-acetyltransferase n=1 Tax=Kitasatospora sp. DSM 101779 TaxID=2853165 RepID=UPI0021D9FBAE|nr:GNAT family N-acetyltransferase [Kitasatospora sp. DSM 101779]